MNAAARALSQGSVFEGGLSGSWLTKNVALIIGLIILNLFSGLLVIYSKDLLRDYTSDLQALSHQQQQAQMVHSRLLLEKGTWDSPKTIQNMAKNKLSMQSPTSKRIIVIES